MSSLEPRHLQAVERWTLALGAAVIVAAFVAAPRRVAFAATVGAALMAGNAWAIRKLAERLARSAAENRPAAVVLLFNLKMLVLAALVYVAVKLLGLDAIGFLVGVSIFPVAIVVAALRLNLGSDGPPGSDIDHDPAHAPPAGDR